MNQRISAMGRRIRRLKTLPVLPTVLTAGNLSFGITAILCAAHYDRATHPNMLMVGAWMIFAAMVCDMLDGKVARLTRTEGPFGAELDSLADVVSFGVAPAILVHRLVLGAPGVFDHGQRLLWFLTVFYPVMAAIRLARYNVEHNDAPTGHFRGLPSPGAAAVVCSWIILHNEFGPWLQANGLIETADYKGLESLDVFRWAILTVSVVAALLMVSTIRYPHIGNSFFGRIGFRTLILGLGLISLLVFLPALTLFVTTTSYLLYGLLLGAVQAWRQWRTGRNPLVDEDEEEAEDAGLLGTGDDAVDHGPAPGR